MKLKYIWMLLLAVGFVACEDGKYDVPVEPPIPVDPGSADFSTFVSVGNSLTAGFADGGFFQAGQSTAFTNILAGTFAEVGGGEYTIPFTSDNLGGLLLGGTQIRSNRFFFDGSGLAVVPGTPTTEVSDIKPGPYNNMGVPGAKSFHVLANGYGNIAGLALGQANPYFVRMASNPNASMLEDALAQSPSFFTLWIGGNDVLGYAYAGGDDSDSITDIAVFDNVYGTIIGALTAGGAQGVVANLPNVLDAAAFQAVPFNPLDPSNPDFGPLIPSLNAAYAQLNAAYAFLGVPERSVVFSETEASAVVIQDESLANISAQLTQVLIGGGLDPTTATLLGNQYGQSRQANAGDLLTFTSQLVIAEVNEEYFAQLVALGVPPEQAGQLSVYGLTFPLPDGEVLIPAEIEEIEQTVIAYNQVIESKAAAVGIPVVDIYALYQEAANGGYQVGDFTFTNDFLTGGLNSLDGIHLTPRANAVVANEFLKVIDQTYGSNFEEAGRLANIGDYPVFFPVNLP